MGQRYPQQLLWHYLAIMRYFGALLLGVGGSLLLPWFTLFFFPGEIKFLQAFITPAFIGLFLGGLLWFIIPEDNLPTLTLQDAAVVVTATWLMAVLLGALPFFLSGTLNFVDAIFEAMSGWTGAGLTMVDPDSTPPVFLLWRSIMQYVGSAGFAVMMLSAIIGPRATGLYEAEARSDHLVPSVLETAKLFLRLYFLYFLMGTLLYKWAGMSIFEAINHSMAALSAGGFSTRTASIAAWDSLAVEVVSMLLMVLGTINFTTHLAVYATGSLRPLRDNEITLFSALVIMGITLIYWVLGPIGLRPIAFQVVSALTTGGFGTADISGWGDLPLTILTLLMLIGAGTGATAGAIKLYRVSVAIHALGWTLQEKLRPPKTMQRRSIWRRGEIQTLEPGHIVDIYMYIIIYLMTVFLGILVFLFAGFSLTQSLFEFSSSLGTVGLSIGITRVDMPLGPKIAQIVGMLLGRLEFMAVFVAVIRILGDLRDYLQYLKERKAV